MYVLMDVSININIETSRQPEEPLSIEERVIKRRNGLAQTLIDSPTYVDSSSPQ